MSKRTCSVEDCGRPVLARGWCGKHYQRWISHGDALHQPAEPILTCTFAGCGKPHASHGLCNGHYLQERAGIPLRPLRHRYTLNESFFDEIVTEEQAYWLGFATADGGVIQARKTFSFRVELAERDGEHVRRLISALGSDKEPWYRSSSRSAYSNSVFAGVSFDSRHLIEALARHGVGPRKSASARPWAGPAALMSHYWRGLFDGDGSISRVRSTGSWSMTLCGSEACVRAFAAWASDVSGSRARPRPGAKTKSCWTWTLCGTRMAKLLAAALYEDATVALPRKQERAAELLALDLDEQKAQLSLRKSAWMRAAWARAPVREQGGHRKQPAP